MNRNSIWQIPTGNIFDTSNITRSPLWLTKNAQIETSYRKTSSISRTKSQSLSVSCILAQLSSLNPLKPGVKLRMKM